MLIERSVSTPVLQPSNAGVESFLEPVFEEAEDEI